METIDTVTTRPRARVIAAQVVPFLDGWTLVLGPDPEEPRHYAEVRRGVDGATITFSIHSWPTPVRLLVSGDFPRDAAGHSYLPSNVSRPSISITPTRPAETIARQIERRLLPAYLPLYEQAAVAQREEQTAIKAADVVAGQLAELLDSHVRPPNRYGSRDRERHIDPTTREDDDLKVTVRDYGAIIFRAETRDMARARKIARCLHDILCAGVQEER